MTSAVNAIQRQRRRRAERARCGPQQPRRRPQRCGGMHGQARRDRPLPRTSSRTDTTTQREPRRQPARSTRRVSPADRRSQPERIRATPQTRRRVELAPHAATGRSERRAEAWRPRAAAARRPASRAPRRAPGRSKPRLPSAPPASAAPGHFFVPDRVYRQAIVGARGVAPGVISAKRAVPAPCRPICGR